MSNPFESTFESLGKIRGSISPRIHQTEFERLLNLLGETEGKLVSLRAPRAGYGKTMLLSRVQDAVRNAHLFIPVHLAEGNVVEPALILEDLLARLSEDLPAGGGLTRLDLHIRRIFSLALAPLVYSGEIPCQDREAAFLSLRDRPVESFDFQNEESAIAQWCKTQFDLLAPRLATEISRQSGAGGRDSMYWLELFYQFASQPLGHPQRVNAMMETVFGPASRFRSGAGFQEALASLLSIVGLCESVVLIMDEVEGLSSNSDAALRAATCVCGLWESAPKTSVILSINDDVWDSAFAPRLPLGLKDRFDNEVIQLSALDEEEAKNLLESRAPELGSLIWDRLDLVEEDLYPRKLLRKARQVWKDLDAERREKAELELEKDREAEARLAATRDREAEEAHASLPNPFGNPPPPGITGARPFASPAESHSPEPPAPRQPSSAERTSYDPARPFATGDGSFANAAANYPPFQSQPQADNPRTARHASPFSIAGTSSAPVSPPPSRPAPDGALRVSSEAPPQPITPEAPVRNPFSPFAESRSNPESEKLQDSPPPSTPRPEPETPAPQASAPPEPAAPAPEVSADEGESDSVEELLRQFRERNTD